MNARVQTRRDLRHALLNSLCSYDRGTVGNDSLLVEEMIVLVSRFYACHQSKVSDENSRVLLPAMNFVDSHNYVSKRA